MNAYSSGLKCLVTAEVWWRSEGAAGVGEGGRRKCTWLKGEEMGRMACGHTPASSFLLAHLSMGWREGEAGQEEMVKGPKGKAWEGEINETRTSVTERQV